MLCYTVNFIADELPKANAYVLGHILHGKEKNITDLLRMYMPRLKQVILHYDVMPETHDVKYDISSHETLFKNVNDNRNICANFDYFV